ncbi:MAG TPA: hypothetical protein VGM19_08040 [Armatimonadota bacterium]|jgi:hypothetical protein
MRTVLVVFACLLVMAGATLAQPPPAGGPMMGMGHMGMGGMMMGMGSPLMGADVAVAGGNVYLLEGMTLKKFGPDLQEIKTIQLPDPAADMEKMMDSGMCPMCGGAMDGMAPPPPPPAGAAPGPWGRDGMTPMMCHMCKQHMMSTVKLVADDSGVYLLRMGHLYVFDQDLALVREAQLVTPQEMAPSPQMQQMMERMRERMQGRGMACPMMGAPMRAPMRPGMVPLPPPPPPMPGGPPRPARPEPMHMNAAACSVCRADQALGVYGRRSGSFGTPEMIEIPNGEMVVAHRPCPIQTGPVELHVHVDQADENPDGGATLSAYIYPQGDESAGHMIMFKTIMAGRFLGKTTLSGAGPWEVAIRVKRAYMQDSVTYWTLTLGCPNG